MAMVKMALRIGHHLRNRACIDCALYSRPRMPSALGGLHGCGSPPRLLVCPWVSMISPHSEGGVMIRKVLWATALAVAGLGIAAGFSGRGGAAAEAEKPAAGKTAPFVHCVIFHLKKDAPADAGDF